LEYANFELEQLYLIEPDRPLRSPRQPLTGLPLVILVGLTGVGKSTALAQLASIGIDFTLLPNRRTLTDEIIITGCNERRVSYPAGNGPAGQVRIHRPLPGQISGGLAHAFSRLAVDPTNLAAPLIFDGLRGVEEVRQASSYFPVGRFIVLDAPDTVRLSRLLQRADTFDAVEINLTGNHNNLISALRSIPGIDATFRSEQLNQIAHVTQTAHLDRLK